MQFRNESIRNALDRIDAKADTAEIAFGPRALAAVLLVFLGATDFGHTLLMARAKRQLRVRVD